MMVVGSFPILSTSIVQLTSLLWSFVLCAAHIDALPLLNSTRLENNYIFYALCVNFFWCFLISCFFSLSRYFFCSAALRDFSSRSLFSFLAFSRSIALSSAFSSSSAFCNLLIASSRVVRTLRITSGRKCADCTRVSGRRTKYSKSGRTLE